LLGLQDVIPQITLFACMGARTAKTARRVMVLALSILRSVPLEDFADLFTLELNKVDDYILGDFG
jgi:hypothetical protein